MRAIDKLDRLGISGVQQLLGDGRKDELGDFTKGAGLKADDIALVVGAIEQGAQIDARLCDSKIGQEGRDELDAIGKLVAASGYGSDQIVIDPSVVRGLEYYTGPSTRSNSRSKPKTKKAARALRLGRWRRAL